MVPKVSTNANGYEIRTKVLELAQGQVWQDYNAKVNGYELAITKDGDEVVTTVAVPSVPGADAVLDAANKFIEFVNGNKPK
jgi:hypothetical protein